MQTVRILVTGNPGLEDIMALEALEEAGKYARSVREARGQGRIIVEAEDHPALVARLARMRSAHGIVLLLYEGRVGKDRRALDTIKEAVRGSGIHEHLPRHSTFAVEAERMGEGHEYTSMDIARAVGEAVINATVERAGWKPMVRLNSPHVVVYAEVYGEDFRVGVSLSGEYSMHRRGYRVYDHPAALKPSIAYSMVRISGAADGSTIVDPMCGGGTIAIEAALLFESSRIACMDKSSAHLKGAIANATMAGVANRVDFILGDAREMDNYFEPETIEAIISNPPYGLRMGNPRAVRRLYRLFMESAWKTLKPKGRIVLITPEKEAIIGIAGKIGLAVKEVRSVRHGDLWASIITLAKQ